MKHVDCMPDVKLAPRRRGGRPERPSRVPPDLLLDASFDAMWWLDSAGVIGAANRAAGALLGSPRSALLGRPLAGIVEIRPHPAEHDLARRHDLTDLPGTLCSLLCAGRPPATVVLRKTRIAGGQLWVVRDVTPSGPVAELLDRRNRLLVEAERVGRMGAWELDIKTGYLRWTPEQGRLMGLEDTATLTVEDSYALYTDTSRAIVREAFEAAVNQGTPYDLELEIITGHGRHMWVREVCRPSFRRGRLVSLVGVDQDITERRRMDQLLAKIADSERARIGADLHDGVGQELTGLTYMLQALADRHRRDRPELAREVHELAALSRRSIQSLREVTHMMVPMEFRQAGFIRVCRELAAATRKTWGVGVRFRAIGDHALEPASATAENLYRIAQEAIANAIKHGRARHLTLTLRLARTRLVFVVADDGCGIESTEPAGGVGLQIMRYRARMLGGLLDVERIPRGGTRVRCVVPTASARNE